MKTKNFFLGSISCLLLSVLLTFNCNNMISAKASSTEEVPDPLDQKRIVQVDESRDFSTDSVIVVLDKKISNPLGLASDVIQNIFSKVNYQKIKDLSGISMNNDLESFYSNHSFRQILRVDLREKTKENVLKVVKQLQSVDEVLYVGPDYIERGASLSPNDPLYVQGEQWGLNGMNGIGTQQAWNITTGYPEVTVGVIDSGIANHPDLSENLSDGYDFYNDNSVTTDDGANHGTPVAGIIAAVSNSIGIVGVAPNVKVAALQTSYWNNEENDYLHKTSDRIEAITYATNLWGTTKQISILNHSITGFGINVDLLYAIAQYPGLFVWAAGNGEENAFGVRFGVNVDNFAEINRFNLDNLISVGGLAVSDSNIIVRLQMSNFGNAVNVYAPGGDIISTNSTGNYESADGTSLAAAFVSGVAALLLSDNPGLTASQVKTAIIEGGDFIGINWGDDPAGGQSLSAIGSLNYSQQNYAVIPAPLRLSVVSKTNSVWTIELHNPNNFPYTVEYNAKMCFHNDAQNYSSLGHVVPERINARDSITVEISENLLAGWITASICYWQNGQKYRVISCAHGLTTSSDVFNYPVEHYRVSISS